MKTLKQLRQSIFERALGYAPYPIHYRFASNDLSEEAEEDHDHFFFDSTPRSAYEDLSEKLSKNVSLKGDHEKYAIAAYTGSAYEDINHNLHHNRMPASQIRHVHELDNIIHRHPSEHSYMTHAGLRFDPRQHMDSKGLIRSRGYISTSISPNIARNFAGMEQQGTNSDRLNATYHRHFMNLSIKPGDLATHIDKFSGNTGEFETIVKRGAVLKIHKSVLMKDKLSDQIKPKADKSNTYFVVHHATIEGHET